MIKKMKILAGCLDRVFVFFCAYMGINFLMKADYLLAGVWFGVHGAWCCSMSLIKIYEAITGKDYVTGEDTEA